MKDALVSGLVALAAAASLALVLLAVAFVIRCAHCGCLTHGYSIVTILGLFAIAGMALLLVWA